MSRTIDRASFAVTSDGAVLLNVAEFNVPKRLETLVRLARTQPGALFIGVHVTQAELRRLRRALGDAESNAAAHLVGRRHRRAKR
jgi:hypothetical protein